ncbi:unnamed protein product [Callosobruchus maculatus]|uniref:Uncharacterized protein n=1 Tax=Callosobruchus maculatus TaxID=64391 RepID=A0A653C6Y5_CALMS|nr:unnamed protein product [Callosobruchus maculatus]
MDFSLNKEQRIEKALTTFGVTNEELQDTIQTIKSWFATQKHLPETPTNRDFKSGKSLSLSQSRNERDCKGPG